jgi:hypothetical protein
MIAWHPRGVPDLSDTDNSPHPHPSRPTVAREVRDLLRKMSWRIRFGEAPPILGELLKLGIEVYKATVARYMARRQEPPFQTWHFLKCTWKELFSADFLWC